MRALIGVCSRTDRGFVVVVRRAGSGEDVSTLIADVAGRNIQRRSNLPLDGSIPLIDGRQPLNCWTNSRRHSSVWPLQRKIALWRNSVQDVRERKSRWTLTESEHKTAVVG